MSLKLPLKLPSSTFSDCVVCEYDIVVAVGNVWSRNCMIKERIQVYKDHHNGILEDEHENSFNCISLFPCLE